MTELTPREQQAYDAGYRRGERDAEAKTREIAQAAATLQRNVDTTAHNIVVAQRDAALGEVERLRAERDTPHIVDFLEAVKLEALHQRERWGSEHDAGKEPSDWFWLLGFLSGKALAAAVQGNRDKALHHTISSAAVMLNWHAALSGANTAMRPGIEAKP